MTREQKIKFLNAFCDERQCENCPFDGNTSFWCMNYNEYTITDEALDEAVIRVKNVLGLTDAVNHPSHYTNGSIECIDAMESAFGKDNLRVYCRIAAFKYLWRSELKNGDEDIEKAIWYLNKYKELGNDTVDNGQTS